MMKKGVYAPTLSVLDENCSLDIDETVSHAERIITEGFLIKILKKYPDS